MKEELKPSWSKEQQAAGERVRQAWEEFFFPEKPPEQPLLGRPEEQRVASIQAGHEAELLRYPNVVGVGSGIQTKQGRPTGERCLVVLVERKIPRDKLGEGDILPSEIEGIPVDVVEAGKFEPLPM